MYVGCFLTSFFRNTWKVAINRAESSNQNQNFKYTQYYILKLYTHNLNTVYLLEIK